MKKLRVFLLLFVLLATILGGQKAFAATPTVYNYPDVGGPTIEGVDIYNNYVETGDMLVVVRYYMEYSAAKLPTTMSDQLWVARYINTVEMSRSSPYPYVSSGYDHGLVAMYLDAASAPAWGGAYKIEFTGSPTADWLSLLAAQAMGSAQACDGGVYTNDTAASNSAAANDMTLLPATPAANDAYYFGATKPFNKITLNIGTQGVGTWTGVWEYYNGASWVSLTGVTDGTVAFTSGTGNQDVTFTMPVDWASTTVNSVAGYYVRLRLSAYSAVTTQPKGTQCWINSGATPPTTNTYTINWHNTASTTATSALLGANIINWVTTLGSQWSITMTQSTSAGTKLSSYGEAYVGNVIPNVRNTCPQIYASTASQPTYNEPEEYNTPYTAEAASWWPFNTKGITEDWLGVDDDAVFRNVIVILVLVAAAAYIGKRVERIDLGIFCILPFIPITAALGALSLAWAIVFAMLCIFALLFNLIIQRGAA